ncbi:MAG TPA: hypothetical protein V6D18_15860 [Thermosynechococcaceae cyanobacterium]
MGLPSISLSQGELFAVTLGARMLEAYAGLLYVTELRSAILRLNRRLPEQTWVDLQQVATKRILFRSGVTLTLIQRSGISWSLPDDSRNLFT